MFAFASCNNKSDCDCTVKMGEVSQVVPVTDFDGDCDQINASNLANWDNIEELGGSFKCVEQ